MEGGIGVEQATNLVPKGSRELLGQLTNTHRTQEAEKVAKEVGYDEQRVRQSLTDMANSDPDEYGHFVYALRKDIQSNEAQVAESFSKFSVEHPETAESQARKEELKKRVISLGDETVIGEELSQGLRDVFPSGNYLVHGTSVEGGLALAADKDGKLKSVAEIRKTDEKFKGKAGFMGVSFSYDGVGALPGTWRHMTMFVTSPELALKEVDKKLVVPYYAANKELQLVGSSYDRNVATYVDSTMDFLGLSNIMGNKGVIHDFIELETPYNTTAGDTPIERDIKRLKADEIKPEDISGQYEVVEGKFKINPSAMEGQISEGTIWADYLLRYSEEGRKLGKTLADVTPQELVELHIKTKEDVREIVRDVERVADVMTEGSAAAVDIEDTVMFIPRGDVDKWLDVFSRTGKAPRAFVTFSPTEGPKVPNWKTPEGEWDKAENVVNGLMQKIGVGQPTLPFSEVMGKEVTEADLTGNYIKRVNWDVVKKSSDLVMKDGVLKLVTSS